MTGLLDAPALVKLYRQHDLFVWPAIREAYGMALLEAQAHGLAAVAGDAGGVPDIVRDGLTGLLAPEGDAEGFAAQLTVLLQSPDTLARLGANAARITAAEHGVEGASMALDAAFREVIA
jgi:glycosyltransferase involved in cell wall biosynthesis